LFVASHRGRRRHLANVFVGSKILQPPDQIAILAHLQSFIETTDAQEVLLWLLGHNPIFAMVCLAAFAQF